jgi:hypothetical protein
MNDHEATATAEKAPEAQSHPAWCDMDECTMCDLGGSHHSAWMTLGPLPVTRFVAQAYLYQTIDSPAPAAMLSLHFPVDHPDDIANNAGYDEDTTGFVFPLNHIDQLNDFLTSVLVLAEGVQSG